MVSAISSSVDRVSGSNADYSISFQIAALEQQLAVYQRQLENAQQASTQTSQQQTEQIKAQIAQLEAQIAQLKTQQTQQAQQAQQTQQAQQPSATEAGDTGGTTKAGHSNFPDVVVQALAESIADSSNTLHETATSSLPPPDTPPAPKQNPQAALHTFMHNLFTALGQENVTAATGASQPETAHTPPHRGEYITASIQSLIQHLDGNTQTEPVGKQNGNPQILNNLDSSFHDLIGLLNSSQEQAASITGTTLQSFLHNLSQDLSNGQDISGALIDTEV